MAVYLIAAGAVLFILSGLALEQHLRWRKVRAGGMNQYLDGRGTRVSNTRHFYAFLFGSAHRGLKDGLTTVLVYGCRLGLILMALALPAFIFERISGNG